MGQGRYATPEEAARGDTPARFVRVVGVVVRGDWAVIAQVMNEHEADTAICRRVEGLWVEDSSGNQTSAWILTGDNIGTAVEWVDDVPAGAVAARFRCGDQAVVVPVENGCALAAFDDLIQADRWFPPQAWLSALIDAAGNEQTVPKHEIPEHHRELCRVMLEAMVEDSDYVPPAFGIVGEPDAVERSVVEATVRVLFARAVKSYAAWEALETALSVRPDQTAYDERQEASRRFAEILRRIYPFDPTAVTVIAKPYLDSDTPAEWKVAAQVIGHTGAWQASEAGEAAYKLLFPRLVAATDVETRDVYAAEIGQLWNARDDQNTPIELASHRNRNLRYAAVKNLALTTTDAPDCASARAKLEVLKDDPDEEIRRWAEFGLETLTDQDSV